MAYFERADERDRLVVCNICKAKCAERSVINHIVKCSEKPNHSVKFDRGDLERCSYDSCHIVEGGSMSLHLEFCNKRQSSLVSEFQMAQNNHEAANQIEVSPTDNFSGGAWGEEASSEHFVMKMGSLNIQ